MSWWLLGVVVLGFVAAAAVAHRLLLSAQLRSLRTQLESAQGTESLPSVTVQLVDAEITRLASAINVTLAQAAQRVSREREGETEFRKMAADISHDLRTPLTAARGYAQALRSASPGTELSATQSRHLAVIETNLDQLGELIDRLFEYTALLDRKPALAVEEFDLTREITEALLDHAMVLERAELSVELEPTPEIMMRSDRARVRRILSNLVTNAAAHGSGQLAVGVTAESETVTVTMTNEVRGNIPDASQMFERFYTADPARVARRHGLGLAIVANLAEILGGRAWAEVRHGPQPDLVPGGPDTPELSEVAAAASSQPQVKVTLELARHLPPSLP